MRRRQERMKKYQHTTTKINKIIRSTSSNLCRDRAQKTLSIDGDAQQTDSGREGGPTRSRMLTDVKRGRRQRQKTV